MTPWGRARRPLCALVFVALSLGGAPRAARAQIDMTGPWVAQAFVVFGPTLDCTFDFVQTGASLALTGECAIVGPITATGTIDPMTGAFSGSGSAGPACPTMTFTMGSAAMDGATFFVSFSCSGGPLPVLGGLYGYRCGNGVIDSAIGETCDDGDRLGFDCCTDTCVFKGAGLICPGDDNQCTDDVCDGAGTCTHPNRSGPCNDFLQCTTDDHCEDGACVATTLPDGSACDDFNDCTAESCQSGLCVAGNVPDGSPCSDFLDCTEGDSCLAGECQTGDPRVCPTCMRCQEGTGCFVDLSSFICDYPGRTALQLKNNDRSSAKWKWWSGYAIDLPDLGDPTTTSGYEICVVDELNFGPDGYPTLIFSAAAPAGANWRKTRGGFLFKSPDKKLKLRLKAGDAGKAKVQFKAKGPAYDVGYLPPVGVVVGVYVKTAAFVSPEKCFIDQYNLPVTSTSTKYKAQYPLP